MKDLAFSRRFFLVLIVAGIPLVFGGCAQTWTRRPAESRVRTTVEGSLRYGPISGFVQTPRGGAPGTTSRNRPTFSELSVDDALSAELSLGFQWREHAIYGGAALLRLDDHSTLDRSLISHGTTFPAGSQLNSDVQLDAYRFGYQYRLAFANEAGTTLALLPGVGAALLDFDYRLKAPGGLSAQRSYLVATPQLGLAAEWIPPGYFSTSAGLFSFLPEVSNLFVLSAQITESYRLWTSNLSSGTLFLGVGFDWLDYEDHQPVSNHIKADVGPLVLFGLKTRF